MCFGPGSISKGWPSLPCPLSRGWKTETPKTLRLTPVRIRAAGVGFKLQTDVSHDFSQPPPPRWADLDDRSRPLPCTEFTCRSLPAVTHLHPRLGQVDLHGEVFPCEHVRVMCLRKGALQLLQLKIEHRRYLRSLQTSVLKNTN